MPIGLTVVIGRDRQAGRVHRQRARGVGDRVIAQARPRTRDRRAGRDRVAAARRIGRRRPAIGRQRHTRNRFAAHHRRRCELARAQRQRRAIRLAPRAGRDRQAGRVHRQRAGVIGDRVVARRERPARRRARRQRITAARRVRRRRAAAGREGHRPNGLAVLQAAARERR